MNPHLKLAYEHGVRTALQEAGITKVAYSPQGPNYGLTQPHFSLDEPTMSYEPPHWSNRADTSMQEAVEERHGRLDYGQRSKSHLPPPEGGVDYPAAWDVAHEATYAGSKPGEGPTYPGLNALTTRDAFLDRNDVALATDNPGYEDYQRERQENRAKAIDNAAQGLEWKSDALKQDEAKDVANEYVAPLMDMVSEEKTSSLLSANSLIKSASREEWGISDGKIKVPDSVYYTAAGAALTDLGYLAHKNRKEIGRKVEDAYSAIKHRIRGTEPSLMEQVTRQGSRSAEDLVDSAAQGVKNVPDQVRKVVEEVAGRPKPPLLVDLLDGWEADDYRLRSYLDEVGTAVTPGSPERKALGSLLDEVSGSLGKLRLR